jgi:transcriptional regulator with XRE-family HTH domain
MTRNAPLGSTGETVRRNITRLREQQNLGYTELARRTAEAGRPIPVLGVRRIESGERRVDVDELAVLAVALDVSPITLLMPEADTRDDFVTVTGRPAEEAHTVWEWLQALRLRDDDVVDMSFLIAANPRWSYQARRSTVNVDITTAGENHGHN